MQNNSPVAALIVTFNPNDKTLSLLLERISDQVGLVIIVNNSPWINLNPIFNRLYPYQNIQLISLKKNFGIGYAQNIGLQEVEFRGFPYVILFDQDSIPEPKMINKLLAVMENKVEYGDNIIAVGPSYMDTRSGIRSYFMVSKFGLPFRYKPQKKTSALLAVNAAFLISSGSLISMSKLKTAGGMRSNYFIDHVDTEWCLRAQAQGYRLVGLHSALMEHSLGDKVKRIWFFYQRSVAYHSPLRDYYMFRNTILMLRDTKIPLIWSGFLVLRLFQFSAYFLTFTSDRGIRVRAMLLGIRHGFLGIDGELDLKTGTRTPIPKTSLDPT
jgi:rhamnosyltransferase